jgi:hypothetical protein
MSFAQIGRTREAIREFDETMRQAGPTPVYLAASAYAYALAGDRNRAESILGGLVSDARTKPVSSVEIAAVNAGLRQEEQCFEWLAKGFERRDPLMTFLAVDPRFDRYRGAPRFQDLLRRMGFPAALIATSSTSQ